MTVMTKEYKMSLSVTDIACPLSIIKCSLELFPEWLNVHVYRPGTCLLCIFSSAHPNTLVWQKSREQYLTLCVCEREIERERESVCVCVREREGERENLKTLFYKDCSLGSDKNLSNKYSLLSYWCVGIELQALFIKYI